MAKWNGNTPYGTTRLVSKDYSQDIPVVVRDENISLSELSSHMGSQELAYLLNEYLNWARVDPEKSGYEVGIQTINEFSITDVARLTEFVLGLLSGLAEGDPSNYDGRAKYHIILAQYLDDYTSDLRQKYPYDHI